MKLVSFRNATVDSIFDCAFVSLTQTVCCPTLRCDGVVLRGTVRWRCVNPWTLHGRMTPHCMCLPICCIIRGSVLSFFYTESWKHLSSLLVENVEPFQSSCKIATEELLVTVETFCQYRRTVESQQRKYRGAVESWQRTCGVTTEELWSHLGSRGVACGCTAACCLYAWDDRLGEKLKCITGFVEQLLMWTELLRVHTVFLLVLTAGIRPLLCSLCNSSKTNRQCSLTDFVAAAASGTFLLWVVSCSTTLLFCPLSLTLPSSSCRLSARSMVLIAIQWIFACCVIISLYSFSSVQPLFYRYCSHRYFWMQAVSDCGQRIHCVYVLPCTWRSLNFNMCSFVSWRGREGFSHAASAAAAPDSTQWLSRCSLAIIRAVLSGGMDGEGREQVKCRVCWKVTGKASIFLRFGFLLNIQRGSRMIPQSFRITWMKPLCFHVVWLELNSSNPMCCTVRMVIEELGWAPSDLALSMGQYVSKPSSRI